MKPDLSVVIVNWKVAERVERLLESIAAQTSGIGLEMFVVDNASGDGLAERVARFGKSHPQLPVELIVNPKNLGFAAACNQGIRRAQGRYVVLLNPDTHVLDGALQKMVAHLDAHPDVGVAGPTLLNQDGTVQASVRRFPGLADQLAILLKLPHLKITPPSLKRYLYEDFEYTKEADVDQVMGAAFFIRRACLDAVGLLDERFFIWFEEVDFCKRALAAGWRVVYAPVARIMHVGGTSFAQEMTFRKQRMFFASMAKYLWKHRPVWFTAFLLCGLAEAVSLLTWSAPAMALPVLIVAALAALFVNWRDARIGFLLLVSEAMIGTHGHLVSYGPVSIRMVLFAAAILGWLKFRLEGKSSAAPRYPEALRRLFWPLAALAVAVLWGVVRGFLAGYGSAAVIADANAYAFILLVPMALDLFRDGIATSWLLEAFIGGILWLSVKALALAWFFSHASAPLFDAVRLWQRKFGLLEVTPSVPAMWHRIFSASDLFLVPAVALGILGLARKDRRAWLVVFPMAALVLSSSRSFWLGLVIGGIVALPFLARAGRSMFLATFGSAVRCLAVAGLLLAILSFIPSPSRGSSAGIEARLNGSDAAVTSRLHLLAPLERGIAAHPILGSGFGATVTYPSDDPRMHVLYPNGVVTTGAIEWQYAEIWLKMGLPGLLAVACLCVAVFLSILSMMRKNDRGLVAVALASWVAFVVLNIFTPYVNHPLGWMYVAMVLVATTYPPLEKRRWP